MTPQPASRRLSAVMFADIEGYTRFFQQNEQAAMDLSAIHREDLLQTIPAHNGKLVQSYGDGSVSVFDSIVDAVDCAIALQAVSRLHSVPLRIGIHLGDLIFQGGDIFGDAVNIASRIQSEGVAGSILVSEKVAGELRNHPSIHLQALGRFYLKNVKESMALYAIQGPGLTVPPHASPARKVTRSLIGQRSWLIIAPTLMLVAYLLIRQSGTSTVNWAEARIAVVPFEIPEADTALKAFRDAIFIHLTHELEEGSSVDVQSAWASMSITNGEEEKLSDPDFLLKKGCRYKLQGDIKRLGANPDSLVIQASVYDCRRNQVVSPRMRPVVIDRNQPQHGLNVLYDVVQGYWTSRDTIPVSAPVLSAYADYLKALRVWGRKNFDEPVPHLLRAIEKDSTFFEAYLLLLDCFYNEKNCKSNADTLEWIKRRFPNPTKIQQEYLRYYLLDLDGERKRSWQAFQPILKRKPNDLHRGTDAMVMALEYLNDPHAALSAMKPIANPNDVIQECPYCETYMINGIRAYVETGKPADAAPWVDIVRPHVDEDSEFAILTSYYLAANDPLQVETLIRDLLEQQQDARRRREDKAAYAYLAAITARHMGQETIAAQYLDMALREYLEIDYPGRIAACLLLKGDAAGAIDRYLEQIRKEETSGDLGRLNRFRGELGVAYARNGARKNAEEMIRLIGESDPDCDYGRRQYYIGRIKANMHDQPGALTYLDQALDKGITFGAGATFQYDPFLDVLKDDKEFRALLQSRQ